MSYVFWFGMVTLLNAGSHDSKLKAVHNKGIWRKCLDNRGCCAQREVPNTAKLYCDNNMPLCIPANLHLDAAFPMY